MMRHFLSKRAPLFSQSTLFASARLSTTSSRSTVVPTSTSMRRHRLLASYSVGVSSAMSTTTMRQASCCGGSTPTAPQQSGCCGSDSAATTTPSSAAAGTCDMSSGCCPTKRAPTSEEIVAIVRDGYATVSKSTTGGRSEAEKAAADKVAEGMGYTSDELAAVPGEANMGLQCGNPMRYANIQPGEVVVDLGSGGGIDIFLASKYVGPTGKAIGIDMTPEMIEQARASAAAANITNVEFYLAEITKIPLPDNSVDCIISNCVINLAPEKMDVFKEMFRILKPGGRVAVSDVIATPTPMTDSIRSSLSLLVGCVAGAISEADYIAGLNACGFCDAKVTNGGQNLNEMWRPKSGSSSDAAPVCCGVKADDVTATELNFDINDYVFSGKVEGRKPSK